MRADSYGTSKVVSQLKARSVEPSSGGMPSPCIRPPCSSNREVVVIGQISPPGDLHAPKLRWQLVPNGHFRFAWSAGGRREAQGSRFSRISRADNCGDRRFCRSPVLGGGQAQLIDARAADSS